MSKKGQDASADDKKFREQQATDYQAAKWTKLFQLGPRGEGRGRMVRGDGN